MSRDFIIILICLVKYTSQQDLDQLKRDFAGRVAAPYRQAVSLLSDRVIKLLAEAPVPATPESARPLVDSLNDGINQMSGQINAAYGASEELRQKTDKSLESYVAQHSQTQQQLANTENQINQMNVQIQGADTQIATAQQQVNQAEQSLQAAENTVREAERKVDQARNCIIRGRKKRSFFGKIGRKIGNIGRKIVNAPCHVVNEGGIRSAKHGRDVAKNNRDGAVQRLNNLQNTKNQLVAQRTNLINSQQQLTNRRNELQNAVNALNDVKGKVLELGQKLKKVVEHVAAFKVRADVLRETVSKLIDMENLLTPIQRAAELVVAYTGDAQDAAFYAAIKQTLTKNVDILKTKLPEYPLFVPRMR
uniref:Chromosome partition protein Smc n=1 Tax=Romanomermis culicivorax TaxID=13658 RepID=A0A915KN74_ROMCU